MQQPFVGLVLAGGKSSRMGQDKATLTYHNKTWLTQAIELLGAAGAAEVLVNTHVKSDFKQVKEPYPNKGPLSGIYAGLLATHLPLLVLPIDMPTIKISQLTTLVETGQNAACVYYECSPVPCYLQNTSEQRAYINTQLTTPNARLSLYSTWRALAGVNLESSSPMENFNTPDDLSS